MSLIVAAITTFVVTACTPPETPPTDIAEQVTLPDFVFCDAGAAETTPGYDEAFVRAIDTIYRRDPQGWLVQQKSAQIEGATFQFDIRMGSGNIYTVWISRDPLDRLEVTGVSKSAGARDVAAKIQ